jgi:hypothetical protein
MPQADLSLMNADLVTPNRAHRLVTAVSLGLLALLAVGPLLLEPRPVDFLTPYSSTTATVFRIAFVLLLMGVALAVRARLDRPREPRATRNIVLFAVLAGLMTLLHWIEVDIQKHPRQWEPDLYKKLLNHEYDAPHNYRMLPYGFARLTERVTHEWMFSCVSYRWFFTFWFIWASYQLARRYLNPDRARWTLLPLFLLYPLSVSRYCGQLTDPLSHALFVLAFLYLLEDRPVALAVALALGIAAKETVVIVVPAYLACYWRRGWRSWFITAALGGACVAAFLAARLPLGWRPGSYDQINGTTGLMIGTNLGFGEQISQLVPSLFENYLHPILFVGLFLPSIVRRWRHIDPHLRALFLIVTPLLLASNLCFGWLYESRNYMPLLPLLATMALWTGRRADSIGGEGMPQGRHVTDEHPGDQTAQMRSVGGTAAEDELNCRGHAQHEPHHQEDHRVRLNVQAELGMKARLHPDVAEQPIDHAGHAAEVGVAVEPKGGAVPARMAEKILDQIRDDGQHENEQKVADGTTPSFDQSA